MESLFSRRRKAIGANMCRREQGLSEREATLIKYLQKKMLHQRREYVNSNYNYVKNIAGYKNVQGARYLIKNLSRKKLLSVEEGKNWKNRQYLRVRIAKPIVVKRLIEEYELERRGGREEAPSLSRSEGIVAKREALLNNNINKINQVNHNDEKRSNTTVQDMLRVANEELGSKITLSRKLARYMYAAFKQKFRSLDSWRRYIRFKVRGRINDSLRFLMFLLSFSTINSAIGDMGMVESFVTRTEEERAAIKAAAMNHVDTLIEGENCKEVRKKIIERRGADFYFAWFTKVKLREREGKLVAESDETFDPRHFVRDHVNEQFGYDLERWYSETSHE